MSRTPAPLAITGGHAVAKMFLNYGVREMFGMGGFQLIPFYAAVQELGLSHHLTDDERSGAFCADAYARVTGRPGVCDATLGPGATNLVTALVESLNAGIPVIALVGDTNRAHSWKNMTQESRQVEILRPAVKELIRVEVGTRIPEHVRRAFAVATSGRPGPVVLALPEDVSHQVLEFSEADFWIDESAVAAPSRRSRPDPGQVQRAAAMLSRARRPVILAGGGVHLSQATPDLTAFAREHSIPVAHTLSGKGSVPCNDSLSLGLFGRYSRFANELIEQSDCLLVVGCKLGEIATKRYQLPSGPVPVIHLDIDPNEIGRWVRTAVPLAGDARLGLRDLAAAMSAGNRRSEYLAEIDELRATWAAATKSLYESAARPVHMARLIGTLNDVLPSDAIVVADGGFASHWAGLLYDTKVAGRGLLADRGFASIGYGLPASLGAQLAAPDRPVVGLTGDGGLNMTIGGLETARRCQAPFTLIVINNAASGYVKALQHAMYGPGAYQSSSLTDLDYAAIAEAFGCRGIRVEDPDDLAGALCQALAEDKLPTVVDVLVTRDPASMLPGVDSRTVRIEAGDRIA